MSRAESLRLAKYRQRQRQRAEGCVTLTVTLTASQSATYAQARLLQRGPLADFAQRCLTVGAVFLANAGTARGRKLRTRDDVSSLSEVSYV